MSEQPRTPRPSANDLFAQLPFTADGLVPAIAQQFDTGEVLMMAWMNRESLAETLAGGRVVYWSRQCLWRKGDSSGHIQLLKSCHFDVMAIPCCCWLTRQGGLSRGHAQLFYPPDALIRKDQPPRYIATSQYKGQTK